MVSFIKMMKTVCGYDKKSSNPINIILWEETTRSRTAFQNFKMFLNFLRLKIRELGRPLFEPLQGLVAKYYD